MAIEFDYGKYPGARLHHKELIRKGTPVISVITEAPGEKTIPEGTKNSLLNQTFPWTEWIVSDTREGGFRKSVGEFILFLDPGEQMEPPFLEYCFWMLHKDDRAAFACTAYCVGGDKGYICDESIQAENIKSKIQKGGLLPKALFRRRVVESTLAREEDAHDISDRSLWLTGLAMEGRFVQSRGEALFWYPEVSGTAEDQIRSDIAFAPFSKGEFPVTESEKHDFHYPERTDPTRRIYEDDARAGILLLLHWFSRGGADKFNLDLLRGLDREWFHVTAATTLRGENEWLQRAREAADDIFNLPNFMDMADFPEFLSYLIESRNIRILFIDISLTGYYMLPWLKRQYPDLYVADYIHMVERFWRKGGYARVSGIMTSYIDHTFVCNSVTGRELADEFGIDINKITTVHIGVDHRYFQQKKVRGGIIYEALGIRDGRPIILFPCRLCAQKRPFLMLKIAEQAAERINDAVFLVVGDGPDINGMQALVQQKGLTENVVFVGAAEDMRPYYRDAKLTLICSLSEGLTLTAYESLAMGVPVISADVGGQRDLVDDEVGALIPFMQDDKEDYNSRIFPAEEIRSYVEAVISLLSDKERWEKASEAGRRRIEEGFTTEKMTAVFNGWFKSILEESSLSGREGRAHDAGELSGPMAEEIYLMHIMGELGVHPEFLGRKPDKGFMIPGPSGELFVPSQMEVNELRQILHEHGKMLQRHEDTLKSFDEVLLRHEEVVNRHEDSINHQWGVQKMHEIRIQTLENRGLMRRIWRKLKCLIRGK